MHPASMSGVGGGNGGQLSALGLHAAGGASGDSPDGAYDGKQTLVYIREPAM